MSACLLHPQLQTYYWDAANRRFLANKRHALTGKTPSAHGKSSHAKGSNIGIEPSRITPKLGFQPRSDREVPTGRQQTLGRLLRFVRLIIFLIGDDEIGKAKAGLSGVIGLKGGNRFLNSTRQAIGVAENAEINGQDSLD